MLLPSREIVEQLRKKYPVGTRVRLLYMDDAFAPPIGTLGTVRGVNAYGDLEMLWDNGRTLSVVYKVDEVEIVSDGASSGIEKP